MPMTVGVIVNPSAGRGNGREQHPVIIGEFEKRGIDFVDFTARSMAEAEAPVTTTTFRCFRFIHCLPALEKLQMP